MAEADEDLCARQAVVVEYAVAMAQSAVAVADVVDAAAAAEDAVA